ITTFLVGFFSVFIISFPKPNMDFSPVGTSTFFMCRFVGTSKSDLTFSLLAVHSSFLFAKFFSSKYISFSKFCLLYFYFTLYLLLQHLISRCVYYLVFLV